MAQYAIISLGGKQYVVKEGETLLVDRLDREEGKTFQPDVLFLGGDGAGELAPKYLRDRQGRRARARPEGADRQVQAEVGLQAAHGLPLVADADRGHGHRRAQGAGEGRRAKPAAKAEEAPREGRRGSGSSEGSPEGLRRA